MPKRRHYRKQKFKIKLKKTTIYSIFAFGIMLSAILFGASFTKNGPSLVLINDYLTYYLGRFSLLFPLVLLVLGFFFLKLTFPAD